MRSAEKIKDDIITHLTHVIDPELGLDIVNLGFVYSIDLDEDGICLIELILEIRGCPLTGPLADMVKKEVMQVPEVKNVDVEFPSSPQWSRERMSKAARMMLGI